MFLGDDLPPSDMPAQSTAFDFRHSLAYDTTRIRKELGYREIIPEDEAMLRVLRGEPLAEFE